MIKTTDMLLEKPGGHVAEGEQEAAVDDPVKVQGFRGNGDGESGVSGLCIQKNCPLKASQGLDVAPVIPIC